ncbi:MAG: hypothetical protein K8T25_18590 [Planctomycetia bacterium]|nr:hypothetical protein [Planctomycetia bacterium]
MTGILISLAGEYFSILMLVLAIVVALVNAAWRRGTPAGSVSEQLFRWVALLGAGVVGLYTFAGHVFAPQQVAAHIGWPTSPFQYEVGMADLTIGVLGIMAFRRHWGFRLATTVAVTCWLGGDAIGHIRQIVMAHNVAPGNAGPWLWSDILVPVIMIATLACSSQSRDLPTAASK